MTQYPTVEDYRVAVQHPAKVFTTSDLQRAAFTVHPVLGVPIPATGRTAAVFQAEVEGRPEALRFLTREDPEGRERYGRLGRHLGNRNLAAHVAGSAWQDDAVRIRERTFPMVRMEWIEGRTLDRYVAHLVDLGDKDGISALATAWRSLMAAMHADHFAHGDLQHGNVLVDEHGHLRLVDLDAVWVRELDDLGDPGESGHPNYQRPDVVWGERMDTFPGLVVYLSLRMLAQNLQPWEILHTGDNLLFTSEDFEQPSDGPAWKHLSALHDPELDKIGEQLRAACEASRPPSDDTETLLARAGLPPLLVPAPPPPPRTWWDAAEQRRAERAGTAPSSPTGVPPWTPEVPLPPRKQPQAPPTVQQPSGRAHQPPGSRAASEWFAGPSRQQPGQQQASQQQPAAQVPSDGRHWKSLCLATIIGALIGTVVAVLANGPGGNPGGAFVGTFLLVGVLTYVVSRVVFAIKQPPGSS